VTDIAAPLGARIVAQAGNRCGYCLAHQQYVYEMLHIEPIEPRARGGSNDEANLWMACALCNGAKRDQTHGRDSVTRRWVRLFNPRRQQWKRHFQWSEDGTEIIGRTVCGRATVEALHMNSDLAILVRMNWIKVGWHPPTDS
jgi:HNH endonuclease